MHSVLAASQVALAVNIAEPNKPRKGKNKHMNVLSFLFFRKSVKFLKVILYGTSRYDYSNGRKLDQLAESWRYLTNQRHYLRRLEIQLVIN